MQTLEGGQARCSAEAKTESQPKLQPVLRRQSHSTASSSSPVAQRQAPSPLQSIVAQAMLSRPGQPVITTASHVGLTPAEVAKANALAIARASSSDPSLVTAASSGSGAAGAARASSGDASGRGQAAVSSPRGNVPHPGSLASLISTMSPQIASAKQQALGESHFALGMIIQQHATYSILILLALRKCVHLTC